MNKRLTLRIRTHQRSTNCEKIYKEGDITTVDTDRQNTERIYPDRHVVKNWI